MLIPNFRFFQNIKRKNILELVNKNQCMKLKKANNVHNIESMHTIGFVGCQRW